MCARLNAIREAIARAQSQLAHLKKKDGAEIPPLLVLDDLEADLESSMASIKEIESQLAYSPFLHDQLRLVKSV